jgi:hypothetical protein
MNILMKFTGLNNIKLIEKNLLAFFKATKIPKLNILLVNSIG